MRKLFLLCFLILSCTTPKDGPKKDLREDKSLLVLSYNICWECMTNSSKGSAGNLGKDCKFIDSPKNQLTVCANNMSSLLAKISQDQKREFDFVALQEGSRWDILQKQTGPALANLKALSFMQGQETHVTFYNDKKFKLRHRIDGGFSQGRPFQILVFEEGLIFVNLHNSHIDKRDSVEKKLSLSLRQELSMEKIDAIKNFRIIMAGDFNDRKKELVELQPFLHAGIPTKVSISNPPISCCSNFLPWKGKKVGDYILDSKPAISIEIPKDYNRTKPQSDHLPVLGILQAL